MGLNDLYEFWIVADEPGATIDTEHWSSMQHLLLHLQPAREVDLVGAPPRAIRVLGFGGIEVAPAVLLRLSGQAKTALHVTEQAPL